MRTSNAQFSGEWNNNNEKSTLKKIQDKCYLFQFGSIYNFFYIQDIERKIIYVPFSFSLLLCI